ncbi:zf-HC2 domain-containing protein [candidate division KSB1 bacterium]|nr:zf-HC2 domain-containing protein [candidate division KSB1 bacterium]
MSINNQKNFDCVAAAERMHEFLDGELEFDLRLAMERHLAGCADCAKTFAQLRQIENAHRQLDAQLEPPAEDYWQALPQRVMERVKASERRRLLTLPKLPRFKSAAHRAPAAEKPPTSDLLHLPPAVQKFLRGPARYALPLAAVATFCFFMIRELREEPAATVMMKSPTMTAEREAAPEPSTPMKIGEAPAKKSATAPSEVLATAHEAKISRQDTPLTIAGQAGAGGERGPELLAGQSAGAATPPVISTKAGESLSGLASTAPSTEAKMERDSLPVLTRREAKPAQQAVISSEKAKDQPAANEQTALAVVTPTADKPEAERRAESAGAEEARAFDAARVRSSQRDSRQPAAAGRVGVSTLQKSAAYVPAGSGFAETLQRAQQTTDLKKREKIWRDFLETSPDSSYRALAVSHLAQTLAAASDSTTKLDQLEKNLAYFQDHAAMLRPLMGAPQFERELARLQTLVNRRKASPKP